MNGQHPGRLMFFCGKMAAGKSTLARRLAALHGAVLLSEDEFLQRLYPDGITDVADYVRCSERIREALTPVIVAFLSRGVPVVLDFPGNTRSQRTWFRRLFEHAGAPHELHFVDVPDGTCLVQLRARSASLPAGSRWTSEDDFRRVTSFFEPPGPDEGFVVVRHGSDSGCE